MIQFREKEYSSSILKALAIAKKGGNRIMTSIDNAGLKVGDAVLKRKRSSIKFKPKSQVQINRETIAAKNKAIEAKKKLEMAAMDPGATVSKGVEATIKNPIAVSSNVGSKVLMVTNPETAALPIGTVGIGLERVAKKSPFYTRATEGLSRRYGRSRAASYVRSGTNAFLSAIPV